MAEPARLRAEALNVGFNSVPVLTNLSVSIPDQQMTVIVGPNACGKSTLLRSLARLERPGPDQVVLDGKSIHNQSSKSVARRLAILPQTPVAPEGLRVRDLVARGRTPHQSPLRQWSVRDAHMVDQALQMTGLTDCANRALDTLSGGQRQRAWIAMALAQDTDILLLDEPTTYLDLAHQIELLSLVRRLNRETGRTVAMVLHDINLAARFADQIIALKDGAVRHQGTPDQVITPEIMQEIFNLPCTVIRSPVHDHPLIIPA
ncbi:ABC transporter ATP-binding protein [Loktanella agnita]|uniref:ABC transporter ATP-binding protein n=1 Tax=Loktanella agnita TaxID=287097 RepID=UPI00398874BC